MSKQDCYHDYANEDECAENMDNYNEKTDWLGGTCIKSFEIAEAGTWSVSTSNKFCIEWDMEKGKDCDEITNPDECNCEDCEWKHNFNTGQGSCIDREDDQGGARSKRLEKQKEYDDALYNLSRSNEEDCFEYEFDATKIVLRHSDVDEGYCEEIHFTIIVNPDI